MLWANVSYFSCSKIKQGILAVTKMPKHDFEKTTIPRLDYK